MEKASAAVPAAPADVNGTPAAVDDATAAADDTIATNDAAEAASAGGVARERPPLAGLKLGRKDRLLFQLMRAVLHAFSLLPDFVLYPLGMVGGYIGYLLDRRHVAIGMINLANCISRAQRARTPAHPARLLYEPGPRRRPSTCAWPGFSIAGSSRRVTYERFQYWDEIKRRYPGRGIVVLSAHFGNFELLATAHALHGHQITLVHHTQRFRGR